MATTIRISDSINFSQTHLGFVQLGIGTNNEPAITTANMILQTILSPPFCWNWNRTSTSFLTTIGVQDYAVASLTTFGFIEKASFVLAATITNTVLVSNVATYTAANAFTVGDTVTVTGATNGGGTFNITLQPVVSASATQFTVAITHADVGTAVDTGTATSGKISEIPAIQNVLGSGNESGPPGMIAPQLDDNAGNITFRLLPVPDQVYQINVIYQKKRSAIFSALADLWTPIPDHYSFVYQWGFLALMLAYFNDARWMATSQKFVAGLLGIAEGLDENQRNVFQSAWLSMVAEQQSSGMTTHQGFSARQT